MADFNVQLEGAQGAGASPINPVQTNQVGFTGAPLLNALGDIFAKGLDASRKQTALDRKTAVVNEYIKAETAINDGLTSGQLNSSKAAMLSRANFQKVYAAHGAEFGQDIFDAKKQMYDATEIGEAEKQEAARKAFRLDEKKKAAGRGYSFFDGMSEDLEDKIVSTANEEIRVENQTAQQYKANSELRAAAGEKREGEKHQLYLSDYKMKQDTIQGLVAVMDKNFDVINGMSRELMGNTSMSFEQKQAHFGENIRSIQAKIAVIAAQNPELAAPFSKLVGDMDENFKALADPKVKTESEAKALKDQYDSLVYKSKLMVMQDPNVRNAVAVNQLFSNNPALLDLATSPTVVGTLAKLGLGPDAGGGPSGVPQVVGAPDEKKVLQTFKKGLEMLQSGRAVGDKDKMTGEAVNAANAIMSQNAKMQGEIKPEMIKDLASLYSSAEFGKLAAEGKLDRDTVTNVKRILQVSYDPVVKQAIWARLDAPITYSPGRDAGNRNRPKDTTIGATVDVQFTGKGVTFVTKPHTKDTIDSASDRDKLKEAEAGLNTLIQMGAHMEGTTDYAAYWEKNKHMFLPKVYPDPHKLKEGQTLVAKNGKKYKYVGGDFNDIPNNWVEVPGSGPDSK